jgi:multicomponent Na+:H+ antiporter subunit F
MYSALLLVSMFSLTLSILAAFYRMFHRSSSISDRVLLLDSISYIIIGIIALLSIYLDTTAYLEAILLIGILAFLSTIALSRFLERGVVIERKRDR